VRLLIIQNGVRVDSCNNRGWTPLVYASMNGHPDIVKLLLQSGAAVDAGPDDIWSSLSGAS
jgi:ankyrin repeat protein